MCPILDNNDDDIFTDSRDGQEYRTVKIGNQIWMAENLNYKTGNCWAYDNDESNRQKYGLLYDWKTAKSACPKGWHLPTREEWNKLVQTAGGKDVAGKKLKSKSGWNENGNGTDDFGFSALPGGFRFGSSALPSIFRSTNGNFNSAGYNGNWWSASEYGSGDAYYRSMGYDNADVDESNDGKDGGYSVRYVKDV
jgi:uncharacterized protein (TIGR02145 family)